MSINLPDIVDRLLTRLVSASLLELEPGASIELLSDEVVDAMRNRRGPAQFGALVSKVLVGSPLVVELYADDAEIARLLVDIDDP